MPTPTLSNRRLNQHVRDHLTLRVTLRPPVSNNVHGIPVATSPELLLVHEFYDFQPWGYVAIPRRSIAAFRSGPHERFADHILRGQRLTARLRPPSRIRIDSLRGLFESLHRRNRNVVIETAHLARKSAPGESRFYLGRITAVSDHDLSMRSVTALGRWDRHPHAIPFEHVEYIQFDDPYTRTFSKYAPYPPSPPNHK